MYTEENFEDVDRYLHRELTREYYKNLCKELLDSLNSQETLVPEEIDRRDLDVD